jgi:hypothetical protein
MSGESLEDYFRRLNLDEGRRKFLENINEGKYEENKIEEHYLKNGNRKEYSPFAPDLYSTYMKRFRVHRHQHWAPITLDIDRGCWKVSNLYQMLVKSML